MRCHLPGTFLAQDLEDGAWRLARGAPQPADVFLRGADAAAAQAFSPPAIGDIDIEWQGPGALLRVTSSAGCATLESRSAIVHEPLARLYETLPLGRVDAKSRRFWRRVFRLVRIPGGRFLLAAVARRTRAGQ